MACETSILLWTMLLAATILGLVFGSFLNVCIARLPDHESIVTPRSRCLACGIQIRSLDNIPVASWLWLRGRCRACRAQVSVQYPLVELGMALLWVACVLQTGASWATLMDAVACFFLLGLAVMDAQTMLLPDSFTLSGLGLAIALKVCAPDADQRGRIALHTVADALIAAALLLVVWALYWLVRRRHGVGMGDVKLLAMIAAFLGLPLALFAYFFGVIAAAIFAIVLLARGRAEGSDRIPFGSFLAAAGIVAIFAGMPAITWYMKLFH
jgi:leader peptidase (prepilin peptidase)/N-methyltransferase